jgi:cysteine desulfurase
VNAYLDNAATAPLRPSALATYVEHLKLVGNPSAIHSAGQLVRRAVEEAREDIAEVVNANRSEVVFTSGGTESDNLAIKGLYWQRQSENPLRKVIVSSAAEHHAVIDPIEWLVKNQRAEVVWVKHDHRGVIDLEDLSKTLTERGKEIALISIMWANNEIGVINPIAEIVELARVHSIPVHSDAVAAIGHTPVDFAASGLSAMSIAAHKLGGPVGVGALLVSRTAKVVSLIHGGGQERGFRSGTLTAAAAKAFAIAAKEAVAELETETARLTDLRDCLVSGVSQAIPEAKFTREDAPGLANNAHFTFPGCHGDSILFLLDQAGVQVSTGAACQAGVSGASHVLLAIGRDEAEATGAIRITFGHESTEADVNAFLAAIPEAHAAAKKAGLPT